MNKQSGDEHLEIAPSYAYQRGKSLSVHHTFFDKVMNLEKVKCMITDDVPMDVEMQGTQLAQSQARMGFWCYNNLSATYSFHYEDLGECMISLITKPFYE